MTDYASRTPADTAPHPLTDIREAQDAQGHDRLAADPSDEDATADIANDSSFPASDAPAHASRDHGEPALSSGYDAGAERALAAERSAATASAPATHLTSAEASGGAKIGVMRYVLAISLAAVIAIFAILLIVNR